MELRQGGQSYGLNSYKRHNKYYRLSVVHTIQSVRLSAPEGYTTKNELIEDPKPSKL